MYIVSPVSNTIRFFPHVLLLCELKTFSKLNFNLFINISMLLSPQPPPRFA